MSTLLAKPSEGIVLQHSPTLTQGPLIVAIDGTAGSSGAVRAAALIAQSSDARVCVVAVVEPVPQLGEDLSFAPPVENARCVLLERVLVELAYTSTTSTSWRIDARFGDVAAVLADGAGERSACLILMGLGPRGRDRVLGAETTLRTLRVTHSPILAVPETFDRLPSKAVIATDFSATSLTAARTAMTLFPHLKEIFIVNVAPVAEIELTAPTSWSNTDAKSVEEALERFKSRLFPRAATVETVSLLGNPAREIVAFARKVGADLIVTGSRGTGMLDRMQPGSTVTRLLRDAECAVLAVPFAQEGDDPSTVDGDDAEVYEEVWA